MSGGNPFGAVAGGIYGAWEGGRLGWQSGKRRGGDFLNGADAAANMNTFNRTLMGGAAWGWGGGLLASYGPGLALRLWPVAPTAFNLAGFIGRQAITSPHLPAGTYTALVVDG